MQIKRFKAGFCLGLALSACLAIWIWTPVRDLLDQAFLIDRLSRLGNFSPLLFSLLSAIAITLGFPGNVLAVTGGAMFGLVLGTLLSVFSATLGAIGAFWLARYSLHRWTERTLGQHRLLKRLNRAIAQQPLSFILAVRFTPISPFSLVNFLFGLTPVGLKTYAIGTFFGIIPLTLAYTWLGMAGKSALSGGDRLSLFLALGFLALLSLLPWLVQKKATA